MISARHGSFPCGELSIPTMPDFREAAQGESALTLLFICTHNRCRSILCEAITRHLSGGRIAAFSAGSQPSGTVHPDTLAQLGQRGIDCSTLRSESWDVYEKLCPDAVITVCDSAAEESCPLWFQDNVKVHWGLPDPSRVPGSDEQRRKAFDTVIATIKRRIERLLTLELESLRGDELRLALEGIAQEAESSAAAS